MVKTAIDTEEIYIGNTKVRFCTDFCAYKSAYDINRIFQNISRIAMEDIRSSLYQKRQK